LVFNIEYQQFLLKDLSMAKLKDKVSEHNAQVYMDIASDMFASKQGVFSFIVRVDGKKIVDYVLMETMNYEHRTKNS